GGVDVCFANPGTSEMHFVAALDTVPRMRGVLALFEGVATGAADGYARIADRPAAVLLHLGPGLGNGLANLHNARRARVPIVVVVGDHATYHKKYDAPLESDIDALAGSVSRWMRRTADTAAVGADAAEAIAASRIAQASGARLLCETFPTRLERGAGIPAIDRLAYFAEAATAQLDGAKHLVLAGAKSPVTFFAYPGMPSDLVPAGCEAHVLAEHSGAADALIALADEVAPG